MISRLNNAPIWLRRPLVTIVGSVLVLVGIALLVLPGPGVVVIAAGLAVLGSEYPAVRRLLDAVLARLPIADVRSRLARLRTRLPSRRRNA